MIVIGTGIAGCTAGTILARHGKRVLLIGAGVHPQFAIGESTSPQTSQLIQKLARDHDVPELENLGLRSPQGIRDTVGRSCGIKRIFGFVHHREGEEHDPNQAMQFGNVYRDENHLFRQDIDAWLFTVAMQYGCEVLQNAPVADFDFGDDGVTVTTERGERYTARFIVDGAGIKSPLAAKFGLREDPCTLQTNSRSTFTHMIGLEDFEAVAPSHMSHSWTSGTLRLPRFDGRLAMRRCRRRDG